MSKNKFSVEMKMVLYTVLAILAVVLIVMLIKHFKKKEQFEVETNNETNLQNTNSEENECHNFILNILEKIKDRYEPHGGNRLLKKIFLCYQNHKDELENNVEFTEAESWIIYDIRMALKRVSTAKCIKILDCFMVLNGKADPCFRLKGGLDIFKTIGERGNTLKNLYQDMNGSFQKLINNLVDEANGDIKDMDFYTLTEDLRNSIKAYLDWNMDNIIVPETETKRKIKIGTDLKLYLSFVVRDNKDFITELGLCSKDLADIGHPELTVSLEEAKNKLKTICLW